MQLVYSFDINKNNSKYDEILELCKISKNLYNQSLYTLKQTLKNENKWLFYNDLNKILQLTTNLEGEINYRLLKAQTSQQILRLLEKDIKSYIKSIKDYSKNPDKYNGCPKMPYYKKKTNILIYTNQNSKISNNFIQLSKSLKIHIPQFEKYYNDIKNFNQIRFIPKSNYIKCEIIYTKQEEINENLDYNKYLSGDLGVDNMLALTTDDKNPILLNGKVIKSINEWYNKEVGKCKKLLPVLKDDPKNKLKKNVYNSKEINRITRKRNERIEDIMHKMSRYIINYCIENKIGNIVIGYNKQWKDSIELGKENNQTFVSIPYYKFLQIIKYKCQLVGIIFDTIEESYTSKCDSLNNEEIKFHKKYSGKRIKRGLFQSKLGKLLNADINGSINILRKYLEKNRENVFSDSYVNKITNSGLLFNPIKVNIL